MQIIQKLSFSRKRSHSHDPLQQLSKISKNGTTAIGFHTTEVASGVEVADGEVSVHEADDEGGEDEEREDVSVGVEGKNSF